MLARRYRSPLTGDTWKDTRPLLAVIVGCSLVLDAQYPRRRLGADFPAALQQATHAVCLFARLPQLVRNDPVIGAAISDAYWDAKAANKALTPFIDERFLLHYDFWSQWREWVTKYAFENPRLTDHYDPTVSPQLRAARLAWLATWLTQKAASGGLEVLDEFSPAHDGLQAALRELDEAEVPRERAVEVERSWRFLAAAGRLPRLPQDADLYAAFEAALFAGADELALDLVRRGTST
jgi:hypothetical protein